MRDVKDFLEEATNEMDSNNANELLLERTTRLFKYDLCKVKVISDIKNYKATNGYPNGVSFKRTIYFVYEDLTTNEEVFIHKIPSGKNVGKYQIIIEADLSDQEEQKLIKYDNSKKKNINGISGMAFFFIILFSFLLGGIIAAVVVGAILLAVGSSQMQSRELNDKLDTLILNKKDE